MKWLDPAWWNGLEHLIGVQVPVAEGGVYRVMALQKDQHRYKLLKHEVHPDVSRVIGWLDKHPNWPIVLVLEPSEAMERLIGAEDLRSPVSAVLGVRVEDPGEFSVMLFEAEGGGALAAVARMRRIDHYSERLQSHQRRVVHHVFSEAVMATAGLGGRATSLPAKWRLQTNADNSYQLSGGKFSGQVDEGSPVQVPEWLAAVVADAAGWYLCAGLLHCWEIGTSAGLRVHFPKLNHHVKVGRLRNMAVAAALALFLWYGGLLSLRLQSEREKGELEELYSQNLLVLDALDKLDEKIAARKALLDELGNSTLKATRSSYYLDRIGALVPADMRLSALVCNPLEEDFKRLGVPEPLEDALIVAGKAGESPAITAFSQALEAQPWVTALEVAKSKLDFRGNWYEFVFLVQTSPQANPEE